MWVKGQILVPVGPETIGLTHQSTWTYWIYHIQCETLKLLEALAFSRFVENECLVQVLEAQSLHLLIQRASSRKWCNMWAQFNLFHSSQITWFLWTYPSVHHHDDLKPSSQECPTGQICAWQLLSRLHVPLEAVGNRLQSDLRPQGDEDAAL